MSLAPYRYLAGLVVGVLITLAATAGELDTNSIVSKLTKEIKLAPEEAKLAVQLAKQCGVSEPTEVSVGRTLPFERRFLSFKSAERKSGRRIQYETVRVWKGKWGNETKTAGAKQLGDFFVNPPFVETKYLAEIKIETKSFRVQMNEDISLEIADRILAAVAARHPRTFKLDNKSAWTPYLLEFDKERGEYEVSYSIGYSDYSVDARVMEGEVKLGESRALIF